MPDILLVMTCGLDYNVAAANVTDGYHDIGIDALYKDDMQNKLVLVQSKWRKKELEVFLNLNRIRS